MTDKKRLFSIFLIVFIDLLGFSVILPLLPFYAETFGANATTVGFLVAIYAAGQMFSAPILGRLSDRYGRRPFLIISIFGGAISFFMLGFANNLTMLFLARLTAGLTAGNISVAQAYITDITDDKSRARGLGLIGAAFGLGFIIGPAMGGILSQWGYSVPAFLAAGIATLNLVVVFLWLPESLTVERKNEILLQKKPPISIKSVIATLKKPIVGPLLNTRIFYGFAFALFQSVFALYGQYRFGLNAQNIGYILTYVGIISVVTQGFLVGKISDRFPDHKIILISTTIIAFSFLAWAFAPNRIFLLFILLPIAMNAGILNTIINSALTKAVPPIEFGGILGLSASLESATRVIAPSLGGFLLERFGTSAPGLLAGIILLWLSTYVFRLIFIPQKVASVNPAKI
ncbi:MAG TPA: MFS transporter [Anaerolineaceae bacterium]|nr:MFS transporter [Anaerolineaceae bacterium]